MEDFNLFRCGRRQQKGHGKQSQARIGYKRKEYDVRNKAVVFKPVNPSQWTDVLVSEGWINITNETKLRLCQIAGQDVPSSPPVVVTQSLVVESDHTSPHLMTHPILTLLQPSLLCFRGYAILIPVWVILTQRSQS